MRENPEVAQKILNLARSFVQKDREGLHVSDLLYPRRAYWRKKRPMPISDEKTLIYLAGRGHHQLLQMLSTMPEYREVQVTWAGIIGTIDIFDDIPVEIKTTRALDISMEKITMDHPEWIKQLKYYCAMLGKSKGQLWVYSLGGCGNPPCLKVYEIDVPDINEIRIEMLQRRDELLTALDTEEWWHLPKCPAWMCKDCEYKDLCV